MTLSSFKLTDKVQNNKIYIRCITQLCFTQTKFKVSMQMTIRESKRADWLSHCGLTDAVTARSLPVTAAYINYCFITAHILWAFIRSINHSSLLISWFICAIFQTWIINKLSRGTSSAACWWMGNSVDRKPVFSTPSSGLVHRAFPIPVSLLMASCDLVYAVNRAHQYMTSFSVRFSDKWKTSTRVE